MLHLIAAYLLTRLVIKYYAFLVICVFVFLVLHMYFAIYVHYFAICTVFIQCYHFSVFSYSAVICRYH